MKKIISLTFLGVLFSITSYGQCFEIESILVDACGSPEGENEMVRFKVGSQDLCTNDLSVSWANTSNPWLGITQNATTAQIVSDLNATILSCGHLLEPTSCILPANASVLLITSTAIDITANSFANLSDTLYVIFQTAGNTNGHFANYNSTPGLRTLTMNFSNPLGCTDQVTYERSNLVNINGTTGGSTADKNGSTVEFDAAGNPTYVNNGCQAPITPFVIDMTAAEVISGTQTICPGDVVDVNVNVMGAVQEIIWSGGNGTFDAQDISNTNYNSTLSDNQDFYLYVGVVNPCNDTILDSVFISVNSTPILTPMGPFTTSSGTQQVISTLGGGTWTSTCGACVSSTGVFDPSISGEGSFQVCQTAGCGQDCITIVIDNSCTMSLTPNYSNPVCFGGNDGDITASVTGAQGSVSYSITDVNNVAVNSNSSSPTANSLVAGVYYIEVTDDFCTVYDTITLVQPNELDIQYTVNEPNCYGIADGLAFVDTILNHQGSYDQVSMQWSQGSFGSNLVTNDSLPNIGEMDYYITISDSAGCNKTETFTVTYPEQIVITQLDVINEAICRNQVPFDNPQGKVLANVTGGGTGNGNEGTDFSTSYWENQATGQTYGAGNFTVPNLAPGNYIFHAINELGCQIDSVIYLDSLAPIADFTISSPDFTGPEPYEGTAVVTVELTNTSQNYAFANDLNYNGNVVSNVDTIFTWTMGLNGSYDTITESLNSIFVPYTSEGVYEICLKVTENLNGCQDSICKEIIVHDPAYLTAPNVFTPGNDGINDYFYFPNSALVTLTCKIMDRWGIQVYELNDPNDKWDGQNMNNGKDCSDGVYFYVYEAESTNGTQFIGQGTIQLIRK